MPLLTLSEYDNHSLVAHKTTDFINILHNVSLDIVLDMSTIALSENKVIWFWNMKHESEYFWIT